MGNFDFVTIVFVSIYKCLLILSRQLIFLTFISVNNRNLK